MTFFLRPERRLGESRILGIFRQLFSTARHPPSRQTDHLSRRMRRNRRPTSTANRLHIDRSARGLPGTVTKKPNFCGLFIVRQLRANRDGDGGLTALQGQHFDRPIVDLGDEDPLYTRNLNNGPPDRRRVSIRWLAGSVLTGVFSAALVGGALQAAIGLDEYTVVRPALAHGAFGEGSAVAVKGDRFRPVAESKVTRRVIQVSTVTRSGDRDIVRVRPYAHIHTNLAAPVEEDVAARIPAYRAADVFTASEDETPVEVAASDSIYGAEVDGEVSIKVVDFPVSGVLYETSGELEVTEVEQTVRAAAPDLAEGAVEVASLPYVDPARFEMTSDSGALNALTVAITPENVSQLEKTEDIDDIGIEEKILQVEEGASLRRMLIDEGASEDAAARIQSALVANFAFDFRAGQKLRIGLAPDPDAGAIRPVRVSLYQPDDRHIATVALSDTGVYVAAQEPAVDDAELAVVEEQTGQQAVLPTLHEGLWGTGLTLGMPEEVIKNLAHIFSYDVDYQTRLSPADSLEVIYSADEDPESAEILYASLTIGNATHRYYRFRSPEDSSVDYYDEDGKSAQKFLMRKPVQQARFTSGFGMRRHPIVHRYRMHTGVDWAAPRGTPIMAAGDGIVEKIGRRSGYGRSITLKHLHGYETTYNHMSGYAKGLKRGDEVQQGQVIGYIGSTGLSTGPHLHYEVRVNGRFVDPMKIRVPRGRELQGAEMVAFTQERERIDDLLVRDEGRVAAAAVN
jgi:murein DD-endopeptidase MepM/ murein hydrolase activator NlpD